MDRAAHGNPQPLCEHAGDDQHAGGTGGQAALDNAGVDKEEIALLIVATLSGDQPMPSTACLVQEQLGMMDQASWLLISTRHAAASSVRGSVPAPCWRMDSAR